MSIALGFTYDASKLRDAVKDAESLGFDVMSAASLGIDPGEDAAFSQYQSSLSNGVAVVFTSVGAVEETAKRFTTEFATMLSGCKVLVLDNPSLKEVFKHGVKGAMLTEDVVAATAGCRTVLAGPAEETGPLAARIDGSVQCAVCKLREVGMGNGMFHMMIAIKRGRMDVLALTSPVAAYDFVTSMVSQYGEEKAMSYLSSVKVVALDDATADRLADLGRKPDMVSPKASVHDMFVAIKDMCAGA